MKKFGISMVKFKWSDMKYALDGTMNSVNKMNSYLFYYFLSIEWSHSANVKITVRTEKPVNRPKFPPTELTKSKNVYKIISSVRSTSVLRKDIMVEKVFVLLGNVRFIACLNFWLIFSEMMPLESYSVDCIL